MHFCLHFLPPAAQSALLATVDFVFEQERARTLGTPAFLLCTRENKIFEIRVFEIRVCLEQNPPVLCHAVVAKIGDLVAQLPRQDGRIIPVRYASDGVAPRQHRVDVRFEGCAGRRAGVEVLTRRMSRRIKIIGAVVYENRNTSLSLSCSHKLNATARPVTPAVFLLITAAHRAHNNAVHEARTRFAPMHEPTDRWCAAALLSKHRDSLKLLCSAEANAKGSPRIRRTSTEEPRIQVTHRGKPLRSVSVSVSVNVNVSVNVYRTTDTTACCSFRPS